MIGWSDFYDVKRILFWIIIVILKGTLIEIADEMWLKKAC